MTDEDRSKPKREAVVLVRIDNMDTLTAELNAAIRFEIEVDGDPRIDRAESIKQALRAAIDDDDHWSFY